MVMEEYTSVINVPTNAIRKIDSKNTLMEFIPKRKALIVISVIFLRAGEEVGLTYDGICKLPIY